jgi:hypothetical protein
MASVGLELLVQLLPPGPLSTRSETTIALDLDQSQNKFPSLFPVSPAFSACQDPSSHLPVLPRRTHPVSHNSLPHIQFVFEFRASPRMKNYVAKHAASNQCCPIHRSTSDLVFEFCQSPRMPNFMAHHDTASCNKLRRGATGSPITTHTDDTR